MKQEVKCSYPSLTPPPIPSKISAKKKKKTKWILFGRPPFKWYMIKLFSFNFGPSPFSFFKLMALPVCFKIVIKLNYYLKFWIFITLKCVPQLKIGNHLVNWPTDKNPISSLCGGETYLSNPRKFWILDLKRFWFNQRKTNNFLTFIRFITNFMSQSNLVWIWNVKCLQQFRGIKLPQSFSKSSQLALNKATWPENLQNSFLNLLL